MFRTISVQQLEYLLDGERTFTLLDVREQREYEAGHLLGAVNLPYEQLAVFWNRSKTGHAKHFKIEELDTKYELTCNGCYIHYLEAIQKDLEERDS